MSVNLDIRWRLGTRKAVEFEPEFFALLQEIDASGSLYAAAKTLGVSYRHAWGLVREWSRRIGQPLAELQRGRGTKLTALGEKLLWEQRRINARLGPELESLASELNSDIAAMMQAPQRERLRIYASHGLALGVLRDLVNAGTVVQMDLQFRGSLESLRLFHSGKCDIAGFHIPYGDLGLRLAQRYRNLIEGDQYILLRLVDREQGIITAVGNPGKIRTVADLANGKTRFINREPAAGTRLIFDALMDVAGIAPSSVRGYENEEFTHTAVAAIVASGAADAGFGIKPAAFQLGLEFIPVVRERYLFLIRREQLSSPPISAIIKMVRSAEFKNKVSAIPGYDPSDAGSTLTPEELYS